MRSGGSWRFRTHLLLWVVALVLVVQAVSLSVVISWTRRTKLREIEASLLRGVEQLDREINWQVGELADKARLMVGDYALRQTLLLTEDPATLRSALMSYLDRWRGGSSRRVTARMVLMDAEGGWVAETGNPLPEEDRAVFAELVSRASEDERPFPYAAGNALIDDGLFGVVVVPVFAPPPEIAAWMGITFPIDGEFAESIKVGTRIDLSFVDLGGERRLLGSTLDPAAAEEVWRNMLTAIESDDWVQLVPVGEDSLVTVFRELSLASSGAVLTAFQRSLREELEPLAWLQSTLLATAGVGTFGAVVLALFVAREVSRPVRMLAGHTQVIAGGDYETRLTAAGAREFGQLADALNAMSDGLAERDKVRDLLDKNVSPEVALELIRSGAALGGEEREVTVMFSDVCGFTGICERTPASELVRVLNRYFERMSAAIEREGGVVDKFIGDAIMAVFGAPVTQADSAARAVRAALGMRAALAELNAELAHEGREPWAFGIGINTSVVVAGNIGSRRRLNYSVIGDGVNVAARLQALTRNPDHRSDILLSRSTVDALGGAVPVRFVGDVPVKGREEAVAVFAPA